jgi:ADP-ribosylglycohydrolase
MLGANIGDSVGSKYEFNNIKTKDFEITQNDFEATDDTIMTLVRYTATPRSKQS